MSEPSVSSSIDRPAGPVDHDIDLLIVGAGPSGLYAAYYAGFRALSVAVVDSLT